MPKLSQFNMNFYYTIVKRIKKKRKETKIIPSFIKRIIKSSSGKL